jgi:predicted P-loop ATPase
MPEILKSNKPTLKYLKSYHDLGFALLWLYPNSKRPIGDDWQKGPRKYWATLEKTFKDAYNVGVRLGTASKFEDGTYLCALDCDVKSSDPQHLTELEEALKEISSDIEYAPRVLSGRGGGSCHIYFRTKAPQQSFKAVRSKHKVKVFMPSTEPSEADRKSGLSEEDLIKGYRMRLAWEVDIFGEGKQVVLPPSIHPDTYAAYKWEYEVKNIDQIPLVENFDLRVNKVLATTEVSTEIDYDYDLATAYDLSTKHYKLITEGIGFDLYPSRSEALMSCLNALVKAGLKDKEINAVLTDEANFMAEKAIEKGSREKGAKWLRGQIAKIRTELSAARDFDTMEHDIDIILTDEEAEAQEQDLTPWVTRLKGREGAYKNTAYNLELILTYGFNSSAVFHYNAFTQSVLYKTAPPWGEVSDIGREIKDEDLTKICIWLSRYYGIEAGVDQVDRVVTVVAHKYSFHPVQEYINGLTWDGKPRLDEWLFTYMSVKKEDDPAHTKYVQAVGRKVLCAAVARVFNAGCKFDYMLILEGMQGSGKSSAVEILASKKFFSDNLGDVTNKDILEVTRGKWLIEVPELASMSRASANEFKDFLSKTHDTHRKAFARKAVTMPRQFVTIGTTNDEEYLRDPTGGRRFWPVRVGRTQFVALQKDRDQLLAEAYHKYNAGEALYLDDPVVKAYAEGEQYDRQVVDEIEAKVLNIIEEEGLTEEITFEAFNQAFCLKYAGRELDYTLQLRVKKIFIKLGYKKIRKRVDGGPARYVWVRNVGNYKNLSPNVKTKKEYRNENAKDFNTTLDDELKALGL